METIIENAIALIALSAMEIVLGIDNLVFISILTSKLPLDSQNSARRIGLALALIMRVALLSMIFWMSHMKAPLVHLSDFLPVERLQQYFMEERDEEPPLAGETSSSHDEHADQAAQKTSDELNKSDSQKHVSKETVRRVLNTHRWREFDEVSWRDIILLAGGLFLIYKSITEIHSEVEGHDHESKPKSRPPTFAGVLVQIAIMDIIFSLDSVITAVGMAESLWVMICAVILAVAVMILFANQVGNFVSSNPTIKMLALNFLLMIGVILLAEGIGTPISKGYIYFAMGFSLLVEFLNLRVRKVHSSES